MFYFNDYNSPSIKPSNSSGIQLMKERKCPIYTHQFQYANDFSDNNNNNGISKLYNHHRSKFVLDKLEESYWANWKPKKETDLATQHRLYLNKLRQENKTCYKQKSDKSPSDTNDILKYFHGKKNSAEKLPAEMASRKSSAVQSSNSQIDALIKEKIQKKKSLKKLLHRRKAKNKSISQEIQTEMHYPLLKEQQQFRKEENQQLTSTVAEKSMSNQSTAEENQAATNKELILVDTVLSTTAKSELIINHKDSLIITKNKEENQEKSTASSPQSKCIRLYRKPTTGTAIAPLIGGGYIKGGSYPLKSCLKNGKSLNNNGNFRLGAPGSTLFVTRNSFSSNKKKYY